MKSLTLIITTLATTGALAAVPQSPNSSSTTSSSTPPTVTSPGAYAPTTPQEELTTPRHSEFPDERTTRQQGLYPRDSKSQSSRNLQMPMDDHSTHQHSINPATPPDGNSRSQEQTERLSQ